MVKVYIIVVACLLLYVASCEKDEVILTPPAHNQSVFLDTILVEPTEIDLHLTTSDSIHTSSTFFQVRRDSVIIFSRSVLQKDTVIVDTGLLPFHIYRYKALRLKDSVRIDSSKLLSLRTMDTTSHDFVWEVDTIGDGHSSILYDVAIINDTLAVAVGELYLKDSTGAWDPTMYNMARWDGKRWKAERAYFIFQGQPYVTQLYTVYAFSKNDIWVGSTAPAHWNGYSWYQFPITPQIFNGYMNKMWGTTSSNFYVVGTNGSIAHYDGIAWQNMNSGTNMDLTDVWGSPNGGIVWACGYSTQTLGTYLLKNDHNSGWLIVYDGTSSEFNIRSDSLSGPYTSVYSPDIRRLYVASNAGIYEANSSTQGGAKRLSFTTSYFPGFPHRVRGNGSNDLIIIGYYNFLAHYNGATWNWYENLFNNNGELRSVDQNGSLVVAVGESLDPINSRGIVFMGRR